MTESKPLALQESSLQRQFNRVGDAFPNILSQIIMGCLLNVQKNTLMFQINFLSRPRSEKDKQSGCGYLVISDG